MSSAQLLAESQAAVDERSRFNRSDLLAATAAAVALVCGTYLAFSVPNAWFPGVDALSWSAEKLVLVRGSGTRTPAEIIVSRPGPDGTTLLSLDTDFRADQYPGIAWSGIDLPEPRGVRLLWRSDVAPARMNSVPLTIESGRPMLAVLAREPYWLGRIKGLALLVEAPLAKPMRISGVVAKPMGAMDVIRDRVAEWLAFEPWTGTSIQSVTGGADVQRLPLPVFVAALVAVASAVWCGLWYRRQAARACVPLALAVIFLSGWAAVDIRWTWNVARQAAVTRARYGGMDWYEKHLAAEDGELFAFVDRARAALPAEPARIFVAAQSPYFRARAAYHLYPHNVFYDPLYDAMPQRDWLRRGDWILVYKRPGVQYDAANQRLKWDGNAPVEAEVKAVAPGAALFLVN